MAEPKKKQDDDESFDDSDVLEGFDEPTQAQIRARAASNILTDRFREREKRRQDKKNPPPPDKKKGLFSL